MSYLVNDVFPAGIVLPYAGATAPAGWLLCDGTSYIRANYLRLFNAISTAHGSNANNTFNVPDYRGRFLRGTDNMGSGAAGRDPNTGTRTAANAGGNTGNAIGSVQVNATAVNGLSSTNSTTTGGRHEHIITINDGSVPGYPLYNIGGGSGSGYFQRSGFGEAPNAQSGGNTARFTKAEQFTTSMPGVSIDSAHSHGISVASSDAETRPLNAYVNYIIKI